MMSEKEEKGKRMKDLYGRRKEECKNKRIAKKKMKKKRRKN